MAETNKANKGLNLRRVTADESKAIKQGRMDAMFEKLTASQREHYGGVPAGCQYTYLKAHATNSMLQAIRATCNQCFGYEELAVAIPECTCEYCPLWSYRKGANQKDKK